MESTVRHATTHATEKYIFDRRAAEIRRRVAEGGLQGRYAPLLHAHGEIYF